MLIGELLGIQILLKNVKKTSFGEYFNFYISTLKIKKDSIF
jgi:hypothetical protein